MVQLLSEYAVEQAALQPERTAVLMGAQVLSYSDLERLSNRIARALKQVGCTPGDRICLLMEKSPDAVAAMIGAIKSGCPYVPADVKDPSTRLAGIIHASRPRLILSSASTLAMALRLANETPGNERPIVASLGTCPPDRDLAGAVFNRSDVDL